MRRSIGWMVLWVMFCGGASASPAAEDRGRAIAEEVMQAMGGRQAYESTRYLGWDFFGRRHHLWDKWTGDLRTEFVDDEGRSVVICMNLGRAEGRVWVAGEEVRDPSQLGVWIARGRSFWINDSYWLVMPYKLQDPGVTLRYEGEAEMLDGRVADRLTMTFSDVGETPENKYDIYVARDSHLVEEWSYYASADDSEPQFRIPWGDWRRYGEILLSGDRGRAQLTDIEVFDEVDRSLFEGP